MNINNLVTSEKSTKGISERYSRISFIGVSGKIESIDESKTRVTLKSESGNVYDVLLKNPAEVSKGDIVRLEKKDIKSIREYDAEKVKLERLTRKAENSRYERIMQSIGIIPNEKNINAAKQLERGGLAITASAIAEFVKAETSLEAIGNALTPQKAALLVESGADIENMTLSELAEAITCIDEGSAGKFFVEKKEITTEEAENIAKKIFGGRMGKDVTDIIKAFHRIGLEPTRTAVEYIQGAMNKITSISGALERNIALMVEKEIEPTISNIYSYGSGIKSSSIEIANKRLLSAYTAGMLHVSGPSDKQLEKLESDIRCRLKDLGIQDSQPNIMISKEIIKLGMPLAKTTLEDTSEILRAIRSVQAGMDANIAAAAFRAGIDIEKTDIRAMESFIMMEQQLAEHAGGSAKETVLVQGESIKSDILRGMANQHLIRSVVNEFTADVLIERISMAVQNKDALLAYAASQKGEVSFSNFAMAAVRASGDSLSVSVLGSISRSISKMLGVKDELASTNGRDDLAKIAGEISKIAHKIKAGLLGRNIGQKEIDDIIKASIEQLKNEHTSVRGGVKKLIEEAQKQLKDDEQFGFEHAKTGGRTLDVPLEISGVPLRVNVYIREKNKLETSEIDPENVSLIIRIKGDAAHYTVLDVDIEEGAVDIRVTDSDINSEQIAAAEVLIRKAVEDSGYMLSALGNIKDFEERKVEEIKSNEKFGIDLKI